MDGARKLAVVNQTLVNRYFGQDDPIGQRIKLSMLETFREGPVPDPVFEIVGVVRDAKNQGIQEPPSPEVFVPFTLTGAFERGILVRTQGDPELLLNSVRREIWAVDRNVALTLTGSLTGYLQQFSYAGPRFFLVLLGVFASVGLVLVATGVYSVIAYTVSRQTHEIGIRMALGAPRASVLQMVAPDGIEARRNRRSTRRPPECRVEQTHRQPVVERVALRPIDARQRRGADDYRRDGRVLLPGASSHAAGSGGCSQGRIAGSSIL